MKGVKEFDAQNPHSATQYMLFAAQDLRAVEEHINGVQQHVAIILIMPPQRKQPNKLFLATNSC